MPRLLSVKTPAPERDPRLAELLARVKQEASASYRYFRTQAELGRLVREDLATLLGERFTASAQAAGARSAPPPRSPVTGPPTGTVTFLFSDIEGSTRLARRLGDGYGPVRDAYAAIVRQAVDHGGVEVSTEGDSFFAAFASPARAVCVRFAKSSSRNGAPCMPVARRFKSARNGGASAGKPISGSL